MVIKPADALGERELGQHKAMVLVEKGAAHWAE